MSKTRTGLSNIVIEDAAPPLPNGVAEDKSKVGNGGIQATPEHLKRVINQVASQKKKKVVRTDGYAVFQFEIEREDLAEIGRLIDTLPRRIGKKLPDYSKEEYIRRAIKLQIMRDKKSGKFIPKPLL